MKHKIGRYPHRVDLFCKRLMLSVLALLTGCTEKNSEDPRSILRMNLAVAPAALDPAQARDQAMTWVCSQLFEGLVSMDDSLRPQPALARSWHISSDGLRYTFILRPDVWFHTDAAFGADSTRRVVAQDVVYSFSRIAHPSTASPGQWIFNERIAGVAAYQAGQAGHISGLQAPNDSTVVITLQAPYPPFLALLSMPYASVLPHEAVAQYGKSFREHPVGTGPYRLKLWRAGQHIILERHPRYYQRGLPHLDAVHIRFMPNRLTALHEMLRGNLDFFEGIDPAIKDEVLTPDGHLQPRYQGRVQRITCPQLTTEYLGMHLADTAPNNPLRDARVRLALAHSIDRNKLVRYLRNNLATPAHAAILPLGLPGYDSSTVRGPAYDPARAAQLLAAAGYAGGRGVPTLRLISTPNYQNIAEFIQKSWADVGVQLQIDNLEGAAGREVIYNGQAQLWRASWVADYPDAENFLALFLSHNRAPAGPNTTRFASPLYDSLYAQALHTTDPAARQRYYVRMQQALLHQTPAIFLFYYKSVRFYSPNLRGIRISPHDMLLDLKHLHKELQK